MDPANAGDYAQLKDAILLQYDINEETYRQCFRGAKRKDRETHRELATRLADSVEKWTKECGTVQEVRDLIVKEQLLNALPTDLRIFVSERKPSTSREAGQLADDHIQAWRRLPEPSGGEATRSEENHTPELLRCQACHQVGHMTRECRKTAGGLSAPPRETPQRQDQPICAVIIAVAGDSYRRSVPATRCIAAARSRSIPRSGPGAAGGNSLSWSRGGAACYRRGTGHRECQGTGEEQPGSRE